MEGSASPQVRHAAISFIAERVLEGEDDIAALKHEASRRYEIGRFIRNTEILALIPQDRLTPKILALLQRSRPRPSPE